MRASLDLVGGSPYHFNPMTGYSDRPLLKKLGIKPGFTILIKHEPEAFWEWISPLPDCIKVSAASKKESVDFAHLFAAEKKVFEKEFIKLKEMIRKNGILWVSWPKKSSKVETDLNENIIRSFDLANGLVDVKVCAVDEIWSGLKFMYRLKDR